MEEIDEHIIEKILNQTYTDTPRLQQSLQEIHLKHKKILILCGSGISKDYGIDTFEEMKRKNYYDIFSLSNYENDTLSFYEHINILKKICSSLIKINAADAFIVTTNIDGMFIGNNVFEVHGNIFEYNCLHCNTIHPTKLIESFPLCKICNNIVRPNIQLYGDGDFKFNEKQYQKYENFKRTMQKEDTIIFEVGCGLSVPILRHETECFKNKGYTVYRVNIKDFDDHTMSIKTNGKMFIDHVFTNA
jgi:NAD-dependent SIR2 family protein deacetylase